MSGAGQGFPTEVSSVLSSMFAWSGGLLTRCFQRHCVEAPSGRYQGEMRSSGQPGLSHTIIGAFEHLRSRQRKETDWAKMCFSLSYSPH